MIPMAWQRLAPMHMLISAHRDGRIIADAVTYFGIQSIAGSTRRGGSAALRAMLKRLEAGDCVGITPDGPRGPAMVASSGIVNLARLAGAPIVPIVFATSRRRYPAHLGPLSSRAAVRPRRLHLGRADRDRRRSRCGRDRRGPAARRDPHERDGAQPIAASAIDAERDVGRSSAGRARPGRSRLLATGLGSGAIRRRARQR